MKPQICFIAHRGYSSKFHPNTEEAFLGAIAHGSGGSETDVHFTRDGVLVVNHNREVRYEDGTVECVNAGDVSVRGIMGQM